ncbi:MAG: CoA ester lyase [Alphaproteobacteria bacterium]|nr:CoA ester lyase [Alphaproteobacteria bacterium]
MLPLRSLLFMPGDNARAHEKAVDLHADAIIFDLEDAVASANKVSARHCVSDALQRHNYANKQLFLRINLYDAELRDNELKFFADHDQFTGLIAPKVESAATIQALSKAMQSAGCAEHQRIAAMIESPEGVLNAQSIAVADSRVFALIAGTNDLAESLHLPYNNERIGLTHSLSHIVLAARAHNCMALDGVYNAIKDPEGFEKECYHGRVLGFDGKTLIHPTQIAPANRCYAPSAEDVAKAKHIIEQYSAQKGGVAVADGAMIEELHLRNAQRIMQLHNAIFTNEAE